MQFTIAVLPGDGIGTEVVPQGIRVLETVGQQFGHRFNFIFDDVGGAAIDKYGIPLRPGTLELCRKADALLFGAVGGPRWSDPTAPVHPEQALFALRRSLGVFANLRPVKVYPFLLKSSVIKPEVLRGTDIIAVRELTGGIYFGKPRRRWQTKTGWRAVDTMRYTQQEIERILRVGFELARGRRKHLTSVDKANVLDNSRLWRQIAIEMAQDYPDVTLEHVLVDAFTMHLVQRPASFDVVVASNLFGDIITDEAAVLTASMGMLPSASLAGIPRPGHRARGMYEPIHGSAPDIAGKGMANPIATILSCALLLRYSLGLEREANSVERAVEQALEQGYRTADIATPGTTRVSTSQMGTAIVERIGS